MTRKHLPILAILTALIVLAPTSAFATHVSCGGGSGVWPYDCLDQNQPLCSDVKPPNSHLVGLGQAWGNRCALSYAHDCHECGTSGNSWCNQCQSYTGWQCDSGYVQSGGSCVPPCAPNQGQSCQSPANACGVSAAGTIQCNGSCSASPPSAVPCPIGSLDAMDCTAAQGWTWDHDATNSPDPLKMYDKSPALPGATPVAVLSPVTYRADLNNATNGNPTGLAGNGNHVFAWPIPGSYFDNVSRTFYAMVVNINGAGSPDGNPDYQIGSKTLQCNNPPALAITGATCVPDLVNTTVTVTGTASDAPAVGPLTMKLYKTSAIAANLLQTGSANPAFNLTGNLGPFAGGTPVTYTIITQALDAQGGAPVNDSRSVVCNPPAPTVTITANPTSVAYGGTTQIGWNSTSAATCTASAGSTGWPGARPGAGTFATGNLFGTTTYTITCTNVSGSVSKSVTVTVGSPPPPTVSITNVSQADYCTVGPEGIVTWQYSDTSGLPEGQWQMQVSTDPNFAAGTIVYDSGVQTGLLQAAPVTAVSGDRWSVASLFRALGHRTFEWFTSTLHWVVSTVDHLKAGLSMTDAAYAGCNNDDACPGGYCANWVCKYPDTSAPPFCRDGAPARDCSEMPQCTPGSGTCDGHNVGVVWDGVSAQMTVHVYDCRGIQSGYQGGVMSYCIQAAPTPTPLPNFNISAAPASIPSGTTSTVTWSAATNTTSCTGSAGDAGWPGAKAKTGGSYTTGALAANTTYTLSCTGGGGTTVKSTIVTVTTPTPTPDFTLSATPASIPSGTTSKVTWSAATNSTSCTGTAGDAGWPGAKLTTGGSYTTGALAANTTYSLSCTGGGGTTLKSTTVTVTTTPTPTVTPTPTPTGPPLISTRSASTGQGVLLYAKTYYARVKVWDSVGTVSTWSGAASFNTPPGAYPRIAFKTTPTKPIAKQPTVFTDTSNYDGSAVQARTWDFGDGTVVTTNPGTATITHMYANEAAGVIAKLTASNANSAPTACSGTITFSIQKPIPVYKEVRPGAVSSPSPTEIRSNPNNPGGPPTPGGLNP